MELVRPRRQRATVVGFVLQLSYVALMVVQGMALVPLYLKHIDANTYGAWLATGNVVAWLALVDPGVSGVMAQRVAVAYGANDRAGVGITIGSGLLVSLAIAVCTATVGIVVAIWVPGIVRVDDLRATELVSSFRIASLANAAVIAALALGCVPMALMTFTVTYGVIYSLGTLAGILSTITFLLAGMGVRAIPLGLLVRGVVLLIGNAVLAYWICCFRMKVSLRLARSELRVLLNLSGFTWASRITASVLGNADSVLVARFLGMEAVTVLSLTRKSFEIIGQVIWRLGAAFGPGLAHVQGERDTTRFRAVSVRLLRVTGLLSAMGFGGYLGLNGALLHVWVGAKFDAGRTVTSLLGTALALQAFSGVVSAVLFAMGDIRATSAANIVDVTIRGSLTYALFAGGFGLLSVPAGLLLPCLIVGVAMLWRLSRLLVLGPREARGFVGELGAELALNSVCGTAWCVYVAAPSNWFGLAAQAGTLVMIQGALMLMFSPAFRNEVSSVGRRLSTR
jgi:O-antigen/teichoic acid export membrane protein